MKHLESDIKFYAAKLKDLRKNEDTFVEDEYEQWFIGHIRETLNDRKSMLKEMQKKQEFIKLGLAF